MVIVPKLLKIQTFGTHAPRESLAITPGKNLDRVITNCFLSLCVQLHHYKLRGVITYLLAVWL